MTCDVLHHVILHYQAFAHFAPFVPFRVHITLYYNVSKHNKLKWWHRLPFKGHDRFCGGPGFLLPWDGRAVAKAQNKRHRRVRGF